MIRRRKTSDGTTIGLGFDSLQVHDFKVVLGWCIGARHCADCPGLYQSKINPSITDVCNCECHKEG